MKKQLNNSYLYSVGDIVNGELEIIEQTRNKHNQKSYIVKSILHPTAPFYMVVEGDLKNGSKCRYTHGQKTIYEGNSLWSVESVRPYIVDVDQAKTIPPYYKKKIKTICPNCDREKYSYSGEIIRRGYSCNICDKGYSYAELFFRSYVEVKGLYFEEQKRFDGLKNRRFDFYNKEIGVIETHGKQHYKNETASNWDYEKTVISDNEKVDFCKQNNINYIEIDCAISDFQYIRNNINKCIYLPNIENDDIDDILKIMENNKQYPVKEITQLYLNGLSTPKLAKQYNVSASAIERILKRNNVILRGAKKVKCLNTGDIFESRIEASKWCGLKDRGGNIGLVCEGKRKSSGKHPTTNEPLKWEYV